MVAQQRCAASKNILLLARWHLTCGSSRAPHAASKKTPREEVFRRTSRFSANGRRSRHHRRPNTMKFSTKAGSHHPVTAGSLGLVETAVGNPQQLSGVHRSLARRKAKARGYRHVLNDVGKRCLVNSRAEGLTRLSRAARPLCCGAFCAGQRLPASSRSSPTARGRGPPARWRQPATTAALGASKSGL